MNDEPLGIRPQSVEWQRELESAAIVIMVESYPDLLSEAELIAELASPCRADGRPADVRKALLELVEVGLVSRRGDALAPTPASLRSCELELGL